jgi:hypothetical protein
MNKHMNLSVKSWIGDVAKKVNASIKKFDLDISNMTVLTEAATGNYAVTPVIAAKANAEKVYAFTRTSGFGTVDDVREQTSHLACQFNVESSIEIIESLDHINLKQLDIVTNTGFLRPIDRSFISQLSSDCVIPLMWEPWEFRKADLDLDACSEHGIKVYGTNEDDPRLMTKEYLGYVVLFHLLNNKLSPFSTKVLLIGCEQFVGPVKRLLDRNHYSTAVVTEYDSPINSLTRTADAIILLEHTRNQLLIGDGEAFIRIKEVEEDTFVLHICGRVSFADAQFKFIPASPSPFGYMSFTTDFIDNQAVIDLHTAGFKVAEGMLTANKLGLKAKEFREFMERNYPALAFENPAYW